MNQCNLRKKIPIRNKTSDTIQFLANEYIGNTDFHVEKFGKTDLSNLPKVSDPKFSDPKLLKAKKIIAKRYIENCVNYITEGGELVNRPNWFCRRTTGEILTMIGLFQTILLGSILPFTCNQGKIQGSIDSKDQIHRLQYQNDILRTILIDCIGDTSKTNSNH